MREWTTWKRVVGMAALASTIAAALGATHQLTEGAIAENRQRQWLDTVRAITGDDGIVWPTGRRGLPERWLICDARQRPRHLLQTVRTRGYAGEITLLMALAANGRLTGVRVIEHRETPGLGDAIEHHKSSWLRQLDGLTPITAARPAARLQIDGGTIDALSGATITSRAVVAEVTSTVAAFAKPDDCDA